MNVLFSITTNKVLDRAALYLAGVLGVPEHPRNLGAQKRGEALISAYRSLAITPGFKKLNTALGMDLTLWVGMGLGSGCSTVTK